MSIRQKRIRRFFLIAATTFIAILYQNCTGHFSTLDQNTVSDSSTGPSSPGGGTQPNPVDPNAPIQLKVAQAGRPVTVGIPLSVSQNLKDMNSWGLVDPSGKSIPVQYRPLVRWNAPVTETTKPLKWVLVDFLPTVSGTFELRPQVTSPAAADSPQSADMGAVLQAGSSKLQIKAAKSGTEVISSLQLNGVEQLQSPIEITAQIDNGSGVQSVKASVESAQIEESNSLRMVIRQDGHFKSGATTISPKFAFTLRYYLYAGQPFLRARLRLVNNGSYSTWANTAAEPVLLRSLSAVVPSVGSGASQVQVLTDADAHTGVINNQTTATVTAGDLSFSVPEFPQNYPKVLAASAHQIKFDLLPDQGSNYSFDGARAKTTDFYLGSGTQQAAELTNQLNVVIDPAYVAKTGAVRPVMTERRDWKTLLASNPEMAEAAERAERMMAIGYDVSVADSPAKSIFEYRLTGLYGTNDKDFGWRNFGDVSWGDGYSNLHYDLGFQVLRQYLRTGHPLAFQLASEMNRYRGDWGQYQADEYYNQNPINPLKGMAFYEKGDHGSFREPVPSHTWTEGLWLYWAVTGDEAVHQSAIDSGESFLKMTFTYANSLSWGESRWIGWPVLNEVAAWRYTGDSRYMTKAGTDVNLIVKTEEDYGRKGYYLGTDLATGGPATKTSPFLWAGYTQYGVIEYYRETKDPRVGDFIVRVSDWLIGANNPNNPALRKSGEIQPGVPFTPMGSPYFWYENPSATDMADPGGHELAIEVIPTLVMAGQISKRPEFAVKARQLFRDAAFYRDTVDGQAIDPATRFNITFRSMQFPGSLTKVYGHTGYAVTDYFSEL